MKRGGKRKFGTRLASLALAAVMTAGIAVSGVVPTQATVADAATKISASKARRIALKDARCSSSDAEAMDWDEGTRGGKDVYQISFYKQRSGRKYTHFVYAIAQRGGKILKKSSKGFTIIRARRAKNIALDEENFDRDDVTDLECDLDTDDGKLVYEVSFTTLKKTTSGQRTTTRDRSYEYTINARSGNVIDSDDD